MSDDNFRLKNIELNVEKIIDILNGKDGVITTIMIQQEKIKELPSPTSLKLYSFCGGCVASIIAIVSWALYGIFKGGSS